MLRHHVDNNSIRIQDVFKLNSCRFVVINIGESVNKHMIEF